MNNCGYCNKEVTNDDYLNCLLCSKNVHISCLKRRPIGMVLGDVFYQFKCHKCNTTKIEDYKRKKVSWVMAIVITLHNLSIQSQGLSHYGYFHFKTHIAYFLDKNWTTIFGCVNNKKRKRWIGTVGGILSLHSPDIFVSGTESIDTPGWWKLSNKWTPRKYHIYYHNHRTKRELESNNSEGSDHCDVKRQKLEVEEDASCSRVLPFAGKVIKTEAEISNYDESTEKLKPKISILDNFFSNDIKSEELSGEMGVDSGAFYDNLQDSKDCIEISNPVPLSNQSSEQEIRDILRSSSMEDDNVGNNYQPRIIQVTNFQENSRNKLEPFITTENNTESEEDIESDYELKCEPSLFVKPPVREFPWKKEAMKKLKSISHNNIEMMSENEESDIYNKLKCIIDSESIHKIEIPSWIRRFYRKLSVRKLKRQKIIQPKNVLDRYCPQQLLVTHYSSKETFSARLSGAISHELFESPFTGRILHPFIFRNKSIRPPWVQLMCELQYEVSGEIPTRSSVDFCFVRPQHIGAVNSLLQSLFWPGIDMTDCLSYPDFSIIALYKKLVIGCAFLVPDVGHNEAYVSFLAVRPGWERVGIASFMLYHLTQTCMGKDITLHVSASNPAICLYQKFGFKIEEVVLDFYEKYLPHNSPASQYSALLLRLTR